MRTLLLALLVAAAAGNAATPLEVTFEGQTSEHKWALSEIDGKLPSDWSGYRYLVVEMRASTSQRFEFLIHTPAGFTRILMHPYSNAWVRAALDLEWFTKVPNTGVDMAAAGNRSRLGYWVSLWGPVRPLTNVTGIGVIMHDVIGKPELQIRSVKLAKESPGDAVLEPMSLVDEFGQWRAADWPGKATNLADLKKAWDAEASGLRPGAFDYCTYGGYKATKAKATGFFRVEQIDGRWWFVDPDGHLFWSAGVDVIIPAIATPLEGREKIFAAIPPKEFINRRRSDDEEGASFFGWNIARRHGQDWRPGWVDNTLSRLDAWGFNTIGNWSDDSLFGAHRKAYTTQLGGWFTKTSYMGLPDVYSDEFRAAADAAALKQCAPRKDDPWLLGYFLANEPPWPERESVVVGLILDGPETATRKEARKWLAAGDTEERRKEFVYRAFERYIEVANAAVRKYDPNHLNLGMRFGGRPPEPMSRAAKAFDVYSINIYDYSVSREIIERAYSLTGRPLLVGEFHIGTPGRGLAAGLKQAKDQAGRGDAYRYYVEQAAAHPAMIGTHWFQWSDEPSTGRGDGENYNIGFVDVTDRAYRELVEAATATHQRLKAVHSGTTPPVAKKAAIR